MKKNKFLAVILAMAVAVGAAGVTTYAVGKDANDTEAPSAVATAAMTFTCAEVEELLGRWVVWVTSGVSMSGLSPSWVA